MIPDAIIILSGGIIAYEREGQTYWRTTTYDESDAFGTLGGRDRVEAAALLAKKYPEAYLVTTSHRLGRVKPSLAEVYADELHELGVAQKRIVQEERSSTTQTAVSATLQLAEERGWTRLVCISSGFHIPRVRAFFEQEHNSIAVEFIVSESVLASADPAFAARFALVKESAEYQKRLVSEARGLAAITAGTYRSASAEDKRER